MTVVQHNSLVNAHLIIRLKDGSIAENTRRTGRPSKMRLGDGSLSPAFEKNILGLMIGEKANFQLSPEDAFGISYAENIMWFPKSQFAHLKVEEELEIGGLIEFENMNGQIMIGIIRAFEEDQIKVDFNHPLAGQEVEFELEILTIGDE